MAPNPPTRQSATVHAWRLRSVRLPPYLALLCLLHLPETPGCQRPSPAATRPSASGPIHSQAPDSFYATDRDLGSTPAPNFSRDQPRDACSPALRVERGSVHPAASHMLS